MGPVRGVPLPAGTELRDVEASAGQVVGRDALRVTLSARARAGVHGVDYVDAPTFVLLPEVFCTGVIEVDLLARLLPEAPDYARGFIGLAYGVTDQSYQSVYLRPTNGRKSAPPPPRDRRAVQYYAWPDWKYDRLRAEEPDGPQEAGADIGLNDWMTLRLEVGAARVRALVNGAAVLEVAPTKLEAAPGRIGLWVDIGTEGFFAGLKVAPEEPR